MLFTNRWSCIWEGWTYLLLTSVKLLFQRNPVWLINSNERLSSIIFSGTVSIYLYISWALYLCAGLSLSKRVVHDQSQPRKVLKFTFFPPSEDVRQSSPTEAWPSNAILSVVQWCEWMTVYGERRETNQERRLTPGHVVRATWARIRKEARSVTLTTRGRASSASSCPKIITTFSQTVHGQWLSNKCTICDIDKLSNYDGSVDVCPSYILSWLF